VAGDPDRFVWKLGDLKPVAEDAKLRPPQEPLPLISPQGFEDKEREARAPMDPKMREEINGLISAINNSTTNQAMVVFRAITDAVARTLDQHGRYTDPGFVSTSLLESISMKSQDASSAGLPMMFAEIHVPAGAKVLSMANALGSSEEAELVFPPGATFQAVGGVAEDVAWDGEHRTITHLVMNYLGTAG
jgi:hypothetical protein